MGTWGTSLFADDIASDVRDTYRDFVGDGLTGPEATDALLRDWATQLNDPDVAPVLWLALAATQWRCGRLEDRVRDKAFQVIESGADVRQWADDPRLLKKRQRVLDKLAEQLHLPQPSAKRIPKRFRNSTEWQAGEIIAYRLTSGTFTLLRVIGFHTDRGGTSPVFEPLNWIGEEIPQEAAMKHLAIRERRHPLHPGERNQFLIGRLTERELPKDRVVRTAIKLNPSQSVGGFAVFLWRYLDRLLDATYGLA